MEDIKYGMSECPLLDEGKVKRLLKLMEKIAVYVMIMTD